MVNATVLQPPGATASSVVRGASGVLRWHEAPSNNVRDNSTSEKSTRALLRVVMVLIAKSEIIFVFIGAFFSSHEANTSADVVSIW